MKDLLQHHGVDTSSFEILSENGEGVYCIAVAYDKARTTWATLRKLANSTGYWPVILTTDAEKRELIHQMNGYSREVKDALGRRKTIKSAQDCIEMASHVDVSTWITNAIQERMQAEQLNGKQFDFRHGDWPDSIAENSGDAICLPWYDNKQPAPNILIGLCPTRSTWEVPAFIRFGAFNGCPHPYEHVAFLKHWYEKFRVEVMLIGLDRLQVLVPFPPASKQESLRLAQEQLMFSHELGWNEDPIESLAAQLMRAGSWYFWWD